MDDVTGVVTDDVVVTVSDLLTEVSALVEGLEDLALDTTPGFC